MEPGKPTTNEPPARRLDLLLDVPLHVDVELGRARMTIQDLLAPRTRLGHRARQGRRARPSTSWSTTGLVARGEAVVVNDKFGIRITDIVSPQERIQRLR